MKNAPKYDDNLWFTMGSHCEGKHYLLGNPHTFPGRMWAWCPNKETSFFVSKGEIEDLSTETEYWIKGFLAGNEPPVDENKSVDFESPEYRQWLEKIKKFAETGYWEHE